MFNILVTGVGAIIGYGIVRALKKLSYPVRVFGIDIYDYAVGQYWCDEFSSICKTSHPLYGDKIQELISKWSIDLIIPGIEQDVMWYSENRDFFLNKKVKCVLNTATLINLCKDKWKFYQFLHERRVPSIPTSLEESYHTLKDILEVPFLLKPRQSYASKGIQRVYCEEDFKFYRSKMGNNFMAQKIIGDEDHEYTASTFGYGNGECSAKIIMQRYLHSSGATGRMQVIPHPTIENSINRLCSILKPIGPTNFQYRLHEGEFYLLEINPRFSSTTSFRAACGFNEPLMALEYFLMGKQNVDTGFLLAGKGIRYFEDIVILEEKNDSYSF